VIKIIADMPTGTIGLEAVGKVTDDDYSAVLLPAIKAALERNDVRLLYVLGEDFESYSPGAVWADTKLWAQNLKAWKKVAIVSDAIGWRTASRPLVGSCRARSRFSRPMTSTMPKNGWLAWTTKTTNSSYRESAAPLPST
jgi:hypothetical protein